MAKKTEEPYRLKFYTCDACQTPFDARISPPAYAHCLKDGSTVFRCLKCFKSHGVRGPKPEKK